MKSINKFLSASIYVAIIINTSFYMQYDISFAYFVQSEKGRSFCMLKLHINLFCYT